MVGRRTRNKTLRYKKRISQTENERHKILILKSQLIKFPPPGTAFSVGFHQKKIITMISSSNCDCRGPDTPHVHYYLDLNDLWNVADLQQGTVIHLLGQRKGDYQLQLQTPL